jgi:hypothetical protein
MAGVEINESRCAYAIGTRPHSMKVSRHWKKLEQEIQTLENAIAAKPRKAPAFSRSKAAH